MSTPNIIRCPPLFRKNGEVCLPSQLSLFPSKHDSAFGSQIRWYPFWKSSLKPIKGILWKKKKNVSWNHSGLILTQAGNNSCLPPVSHQPRSAAKGGVLYLFIFTTEPPGKLCVALSSWWGYGYRGHGSTCSGSRRSGRSGHQEGPVLVKGLCLDCIPVRISLVMRCCSFASPTLVTFG